MTRHPKSLLVTLVAVVSAIALAACGSSSNDNKSSNNGGGADITPQSGQKKGGILKVQSVEGFEHLDPGSSYFQLDYEVVYATQRPLYSFKPGDATTPVPDLAEGKPQIASNNKKITVKIRPGVKFSPPVNREVTTKDIKYAFERAFTQNVPSGYATSYFGDIKGAPTGPGKFKDIEGIKTPDDHTIVFELKRATAVTVAAALVMPITVPVP